jgi:tetratricopeptide (TPR) repeat protein
LVALLWTAALTGCSKDAPQAPVTGLSGDQAAALNAQHSPFDTTQDPPLTAQTRFAAGQLAESRNDPANAVGQYKKVLELDPRHQGALFRLGTLYAQFKQYPDAIRTWQDYIKATDGSAVGYSNLGFCYELAGQAGDAESAYRKGIEKDPTCRPCRVNYGLMLARQDRQADAVAQLQAVLRPAEVHYNLGSVYQMQGHKQQARDEYHKALELDPKMTEAEVRLSELEHP